MTEKISFEYPLLEQITKPEYRVYKTPDGDKLPSVTTILSQTKDMTVIDQWRERVGNEEADKIIDRSSDIGTQMHNAIESYFLGETPVFKKNLRGNIAKAMFSKIKKNFLNKIDYPVGIEVPIYYPGLYAGTVDMICVINGELCIIDWKNSRKMKKREWCVDYFVQGASYIMAHDELLKTNIKKFNVVMVSQPNDFGKIDLETYCIEKEELEKYKDNWIERLEKFYENFDLHAKE